MRSPKPLSRPECYLVGIELNCCVATGLTTQMAGVLHHTALETTQKDLDHILSACPSLNHTRRNLQLFTMRFAQLNPILKHIISFYCNPKSPLFCQFVLDCSMLPEVVVLTNLYGPTLLHKLLYLGRTWCYALHRDRARLLGRWSFS